MIRYIHQVITATHLISIPDCQEVVNFSQPGIFSFTKLIVKKESVHWDLPISNKPATPCLSSRIAYGEQVTPQRLAMIDKAERFLRERGFLPLRVRYHKGDVARIEVSLDAVARLVDPQLRAEVVRHFKSLGFKYVSLDLEGFRSGSLNAVLPVESLQIARR